MPYKKCDFKTFGDLVKLIQEWKIEDYKLSITDGSFQNYKIIGCDVSYSGECGIIYLKEENED